MLLLEAGRGESLLTDVPILAPLFQQTDYTWQYLMEYQPGVCMGEFNLSCDFGQTTRLDLWLLKYRIVGSKPGPYLVSFRDKHREETYTNLYLPLPTQKPLEPD